MARRMSMEQRLADKIRDDFLRMDFNVIDFANFYHRCGYNLQLRMFEVMKALIARWSMDLEDGNDRGSMDYYRMTVFARQLQDVLDRQASIPKGKIK